MFSKQFTPPTSFEEAYANWRKALRLVDDYSDGPYIRLWGALQLLQRDTEYLAEYRPGIEVPATHKVTKEDP